MKPSKPQPRYQHKQFKSVYRIAYRCPSGAKMPGIPHDQGTDILTLIRVSGSPNPSPFIVTTAADLAENFEIVAPDFDADETAEPQSPKE